jgi:putative DNA primase/helicase
MNRLPKFGGDDGKWVYERIMLVKCNNVIPLKDQDRMLLDNVCANLIIGQLAHRKVGQYQYN